MQLPRGARSFVAESPAQAWTQEDYLLADILDHLQAIAYVQRRGKGAKPKPVRRPSLRRKPKMAASRVKRILEHTKWRDVDE